MTLNVLSPINESIPAVIIRQVINLTSRNHFCSPLTSLCCSNLVTRSFPHMSFLARGKVQGGDFHGGIFAHFLGSSLFWLPPHGNCSVGNSCPSSLKRKRQRQSPWGANSIHILCSLTSFQSKPLVENLENMHTFMTLQMEGKILSIKFRLKCFSWVL